MNPFILEPIHTPKELEEEYRSLWGSIRRGVVRKKGDDPTNSFVISKNKTKYRNKNELNKTEIQVFFEFAVGLPSEDLISFKNLVSNFGHQYGGGWEKCRSQGFSSEKDAEIFFSASAQVLNQTFKQRLAGYIDYCNRHAKTENILSFNGYEREIKKLLKECGYQGAKELFSFSSIVQLLWDTDSYPRETTLKEIDTFINTNDSGYITVEGGPGTGKSWILAEFIRKHWRSNLINTAWHLNSVTAGKNRSVDLLESFYEQLKDVYEFSTIPIDIERIIATGVGIERAIEKMLGHLVSSGQISKKLVLVVDALDEVDLKEPMVVSGLGNIQYIPEGLPKNVFVIVSSRGFGGQKYSGNRKRIILSPESSCQKRDIRGFILQKLDDKKVVEWIYDQKWPESNKFTKEQFVELMENKSEFVFIFLYYVFNNIERYNQDSIPQGLDEYYNIEYARLLDLNRTRERAWKRVLNAILAFPPRISVLNISRFADMDIEEVEELLRYAIHQKLVRKSIEGNNTVLSFFHLSFYEFLNNMEFEAAQDLRSDSISERYGSLASGLKQDYRWNSSVFVWIQRNELLREEFIRLVIPVFTYADELLLLCSLLSDPVFISEVIRREGRDGKIRLLDAIASHFNFLSERSEIDENEFVARVSDNLVSPRYPIIEPDDLVTTTNYTNFYRAYMEYEAK